MPNHFGTAAPEWPHHFSSLSALGEVASDTHTIPAERNGEGKEYPS